MWSVSACLKYAVNLQNTSVNFPTLHRKWEIPIWMGKKLMLFPFIKKVIKKLWKICGKVFEHLISNGFFLFFLTNLALNQVILVYISSFSLLMKSINHLMLDMTSEVFSLVSEKHLTKFGTMDSFIN